MLNPFIHWIEAKGPYAPWLFLALFLVASFLMLWRLEAMSKSGFEGTVLGTLVMPYCSGLGNIIFAFILGHNGGYGADVMTNSLVNNVTNMTLVLGLPAIFWRMSVLPAQKKNGKAGSKAHELNRLSLLLTLLAVLFFTGAVWALGRKGELVSTTAWSWWGCFYSGNASTCSTCSNPMCARAGRWAGRCRSTWPPGRLRLCHLYQH